MYIFWGYFAFTCALPWHGCDRREVIGKRIPSWEDAVSMPEGAHTRGSKNEIHDLIIQNWKLGWEGLGPLRKLRSYETLNRWSSGQTNYFGELGPGSIPGTGTVKEILHFLQNRSTVGLEPAILQSQGGRSANCAAGLCCVKPRIKPAVITRGFIFYTLVLS